jgi:choline dehydrogenase-like flavoprotein
MPEETVDVCIIGSGWGGAIPALRLSQAGKSVVVLERGRAWRSQDFRQSADLRYVTSLYQAHASEDLRLFVTVGASILGGTSPLFSNVMLRTPSLVFERRDETGRRVWPEPLSRQLFDPYYDRVERDVGVRQLRWTDAEYPGRDCRDGTGQAGIWDLVPKRGAIFAQACKAAGYDEVSPVPVALNDRCVNCGWCSLGCQFGAKRTPEFVYIPAAQASGARFLTQHDAKSLEPIPLSDRYRVHAVDTRSQTAKTFVARVVILAAGTMATPVILLRSKARWPLQWSGLSDQVGRKLSINGDYALTADLPTEDPAQFSETFRGKIISVSCWSFLETHGFIFQDVFPITVGFALGWGTESGKSWGLEFKRLMEQLPTTLMGIIGMGIDGDDGTVSYDPLFDGAKIRFAPGERTRRLFADMTAKAREIVEAVDGRLLSSPWLFNEGRYGAVHPLGSCRMGAASDQGAVDQHGQVFNYPNLFVTDGSAIPGALAVNPSLTIAANTERVSEYIVDHFPG